MAKLNYNDKTNPIPIANRDTQATAEDFNEIKASVNALYDDLGNVTENYYAFRGATEFEDGTLFYSVVNGRNESSIEFYAPTITSDTGTFNLGGATAISNSGENITFTNLIKALHYNPCWIAQGVGEKPFVRETPGPGPEDVVYESSKANVLVNPTWNVTIANSHRTLAYKVEAETTITNCVFEGRLSGEVFFQAIFGTLTADVEKTVDLTIPPNVPVDVEQGTTYEVNISSPDGDVRLKGNSGTGLPYFVASVLNTQDVDIATEPWVVDYVAQHGGGGAESFTELNDTPSDHNTPGIYNVVNNPFVQRLEYKQAELSDNSDISISAPASGEILEYDEGIAKWINNEPRLVAALQSFNTVDDVDNWQDAGLSVLFANDNDIVNTNTPSISRENDIILAFNMNSQFGKTIVLNARVGETINSGASYTIHAERMAMFIKQGTDWKFGGENTIITTLTDHSATELSDVTDAGSGKIITDAERAKLNDCCSSGSPEEITSNVTIGSSNYATYNNKAVIGKKTGGTLVVDLDPISTFPTTDRILFTFVNSSPDSSAMDIRANGGNDIKGAFFYRLLVNESVTIELPASGTSWPVTAESILGDPVPIYGSAPVTIPVSGNDIFVKYTALSPADITQPLPALSTVGNAMNLYFYNADTDPLHTVTFEPNGTDTVDQDTEFSINGGGELVHFRADPANDNWLLAGLHRDESTVESDLTVTDGTTSVDKVKTLEFGFPIEVSSPGANEANATIRPGHYELRHAPSYYASLSEDSEVVGLINGQVRTGVLWFDNVITPAGTYIAIDRDDKAIGLQEDDNLDPNVTGGTPYFIYTRISMRGTALVDGYVQLYLRNQITKDILVDDNGRLMAVSKQYKAGDNLGVLDVAGIRKFTGIENVQVCVDENFGEDEPIVIEDRTEGNSCIIIQAIDSTDQTSRGLIQCENDIGSNFEWTSHYIGDDFIRLKYFLQEDRPLTTIAPGEGELSPDGWDLNNFTPMKVGVASDTLTLEDDGTNLLGFSFGNVISAEKTKLLRGKSINAYITLATPQGAGRVYAAKWTGTPDAFTKQIITDIDPAGEPVMGVDWVLDGVSIFCPEVAAGTQNTYSGAFLVPSDAKNFAVFFAPNEKAQPQKFEITELYADKDPAISGFYLYAPEAAGEKYLEEDTRYAEFGLNTRPVIDGVKQAYASLRYTINTADTPMPAGQLIKGKADIEGNWDQIGGAVDYLTINARGTVNLSTDFIVYPGEGLSAGQTSTNKFWWAYESAPSVWTKIPESEITHTAVKDVPVPQRVTIPSFEYKAQPGDKLRCYANSSIDDGAYIESKSPSEYLCESTINFQEFVPGSEDEPITSLYVRDELENDWELTAATDGHLETLLVGDLPENTRHHVIRDDFSLNDFAIDGGGGITLVDKATKQEYTEVSDGVTSLDDYRNYIVDTTSGIAYIDIDSETTNAFTVRDAEREFDTNNCIIRIYDAVPALLYTVTLDKMDQGYIFYHDGVNWKYGETQSGKIYDITANRVASADFKNFACLSGVNNVSVTVPTSAITLKIDTIEDQNDIDFNTTTGVATFLKDDCYTLTATFNMHVTGTNEYVEIWIEKYNDVTTNWDPMDNTGFKRELPADGEGGLVFTRVRHVHTGTQLRLRALSSDATKVQMLHTTLANGVDVPSIVFAVKN